MSKVNFYKEIILRFIKLVIRYPYEGDVCLSIEIIGCAVNSECIISHKLLECDISG